MKSKGQGRKDQVVVHFDDYNNKWEVKTVKLTIGQAIRFVRHVTRGNLFHPAYKIIHLREIETINQPKEKANESL